MWILESRNTVRRGYADGRAFRFILVRTAFGLLLPTLLATTASSQTLKIRQDSDDKNTIEKPARLQLTDPDNGKTSWATDIGIITSLAPSHFEFGQLEVGANLEYHRQTASENKQDALQA